MRCKKSVAGLHRRADGGREFCSRYNEQPSQLLLAVNDPDHMKRVRQECSQAVRKRLYTSLAQLQADLDAWLAHI